MRTLGTVLVTLLTALTLIGPASAATLTGTHVWQLGSCRLSLTLDTTGAASGHDDGCGLPYQAAGYSGAAFDLFDGSTRLTLTRIGADGRPAHIYVMLRSNRSGVFTTDVGYGGVITYLGAA
jgi:hypothetical protein